VQDVNDFMPHLIDVWAGVEESIIDNAIHQWCKHLCGAFEPQEDILNNHCDTSS